jgi:predicted O-methyltransferase YrrM
MKLTDDLVQRSNGMIQLHPEVSDNTGKFLMFDDGGVEAEVGEFLYGIVRLLKPAHILETGTYTGISSMYMAQALKDNGSGGLDTFEIELQHKTRAEELWKKVGVQEFVRCIHADARKVSLTEPSDLMFLDSEPGIRFDELVRFFPFLNPGGFVFIHDLHRHMSQQPNDMFFGWPYGELPKQIINWVNDDELRPIHFPTPRGFMGFYKPDPRDFKWK